ncbi:FIST N-terminal domain-containing protein [Roseateles sp. GG27B]
MQTIVPQLLLVFASIDMLQAVAAPLAAAFTAAIRVGCSTAGEISASGVSDQSCVVTAVHFAKSSLVESSTRLVDMADSQAAGWRSASSCRRWA